MAISRMISRSLLNKYEFVELTLSSWILYVYLLIEADDFGFNIRYIKARKVIADVNRLHSKNYSCLENQVVLEKVLKVHGITNISSWVQQQESRFAFQEDLSD
jgi:hypothetical protein